MVGICGPNGSGKTTLLKTILGLIKPTEGKVLVFGKPITKDTQMRIGYMPQLKGYSKEFPAKVKDVVSMGRYPIRGLFKRLTRKDWEIIERVMNDTQLSELADRPIGQLSGGQFQRVMLAQALAKQPEIILLDEPTSALDFRMTIKFMDLLKELNEKYGLTVIAVHHDLQLLKDYTDRIICIDKAVEWEGNPQDADLDEALLRIFFYKTTH